MQKFYYVVQVWDRSADKQPPLIWQNGPYTSFDAAVERVDIQNYGDIARMRGSSITVEILEIEAEEGKHPLSTTICAYNHLGEDLLADDDDDDEDDGEE